MINARYNNFMFVNCGNNKKEGVNKTIELIRLDIQAKEVLQRD